MGATLLILSSAAADVRTATFSAPNPFGTAGDGMILEGDPFAGREVVEVRVSWDVVVADGHDAAHILANVHLPIDPFSGTAGIILDGTTLGCSGSGTINHYEATDRYNGFFGEVGTWWGWQSWGLPFDAVEVLLTSGIEIDYLAPEPRTPGDFNDDGDVDGDDFLQWQRGESANGGSPEDRATWEANFGTTGAEAANATAVPESASLALLGLGGLLLLLRHRRV